MSKWKDNYERLLYAGETELKEALAIAQSLSWKKPEVRRTLIVNAKIVLAVDFIFNPQFISFLLLVNKLFNSRLH